MGWMLVNDPKGGSFTISMPRPRSALPSASRRRRLPTPSRAGNAGCSCCWMVGARSPLWRDWRSAANSMSPPHRPDSCI